jgi:hypothetical protein
MLKVGATDSIKYKRSIDVYMNFDIEFSRFN